MKHSVEKRMLGIFAVMLVLIIGASMVLSYRSALALELQHDRGFAQSAALTWNSLFNDTPLKDLRDPAKKTLYEETRRELRHVCSSLNLSYMYLYTVDKNEVRHYVMTCAANENDDAIVAELLGLGATSSSPLTPQERALLNYEMIDDYDMLDNQFGKMAVYVTSYIDSEGEMVLIGMDISVDVRNDAIAKQFWSLFLPIAALMVLAFGLLFFLIRRRIIKPLRVVAQHISQFDPSKEDVPLDLHSQDEIQKIADAFTVMSEDIRTYIDRIAAVTAEQEYNRAQLDAAQRIQYGMVPASFRFEREGVDVSGLMKPAKEVGGDFYDCFTLRTGQVCALIADVSGKGMAGALFMALSKNLVRDRIRQYEDPGVALNSVNEELCAQNPEGMFVTVFALLLDPLTGTVQYANAGHNPPLLLKNGTAFYLKPDPGVALGLFDDAAIRTETMHLACGDGILLYTDGVTEAINADRRFYGTARLESLLDGGSASDSAAVTELVRASLSDFMRGCEQFDDITAVALFNRGENARTPLKLSLDGFSPLKQAILTRCAGHARAKKIVLACEEAFVNIVKYSGATEADYLCRTEGGLLTVELRDNGVRFDPFAAPVKEDDDFLSMDEGGLGIRFIRTIAPNAAWSYEDGRNVLTMPFDIK